MVEKHTLDNGLRVLLVRQAGSMAVTVLTLVGAGSEYEKKEINGLSHFLEHLCFKGTTKRPKPGMISEELDALGAEYNAFTSQEYTGYWAKAETHKLPQLLELVSDLYINPVFNANEIERERGVVIEEINMYEDMPMSKVQDVFLNLMYGDQPAGWPVAGEKEIIARLSRDEITSYRNAHYVAPATAVVVAGDFDSVQVLSMIRELFGGLPGQKKMEKSPTLENQTVPQVKLIHKASDQSHLVVGVRAFGIFDERRYALNVLSGVLGGGMSSRLFRRVREELGAAYYVRSSAELFLDHGYLEVAAGVNHPKFESVIKVILEEFSRFKNEPVPAAELKKAKDHLVGTFILSLETSDRLADFYGAQEIITGGVKDAKEIVSRILAVSAEDVQKLAGEIFQDAHLNLAVIGPYETPEPLQAMLKLPA